MNKLAIIDIGSHSVRLLTIIDGIRDKYIYTTRLGEGLSFSSFLGIDPMNRTAKAIKEAKEFASTKGIDTFYAYATAAVRCAENRDVFISLVKEMTDIDIEVIPEKLEGMLGLYGATGKDNGGIIDIGGASTEIAFMKDNQMIYDVSQKIGVVRLFDLYKNGDSVDDFIEKTIDNYGVIPKGNYYAIGGTATSLASVFLNLKVYDRNMTHGTTLYLKDVIYLQTIGENNTPQELESKFAISKGRGDVLLFGTKLLRRLMERFNLDKVIISENDNLEGYLEYKGLNK